MRLTRPTLLFLLSSFILQPSSFSSPLPNFRPSPYFNEQTLDQTLPDNVRSHTNAPGDFDPAKPTHLIVYLLPNGNTIDQTLGHQLAPGDDWHYDIQHIAAQTRLLRRLDPARNTVLTLLEAPGKSWPRFRADHPKDNPQLIRALLQSAIDTVPPSTGNSLTVSLVAHSGGGSFLIGLLNSPGPLPPQVDRIAFLDANYAYSDTPPDHHGDTLLAWLRSSPAKRLVVFCYDDRNVTLNGKRIVSDTGGTYRATQRMLDFFAKAAPSGVGSPDKQGPFLHYSLLNNQAQFFLHPNPENKILHTAMIGEMNAFLEALTLDTPLHDQYGPLGGPRAYTQYVQPSPTTRPATTHSSTLPLPPRPSDSPAGSAILKQVESLPTQAREQLLAREILSGNVPDSLRTLVPITVTAAGADGQHTATYYVTPDVLAVGTDSDSFRTPLTPMTAQLLADKLDCSLITRKISNDIYAHATIKLEPQPLTQSREAPATFYQHHQIIETQLKEWRQQQGGPATQPSYTLIAGHKKDVVLTPLLPARPGKVAIYGWHLPSGKPIQPLYLGHANWYVDYSHGIRLVSNHLLVDRKPATVRAVLADPNLAPLLSDEGPLLAPRYPSTRPATRPATSQPN